MAKQFTSTIEYETITINTIVDKPNVAFGETLSGTVYIEGKDSEEHIDFIEIKLLKKLATEEGSIAKHSIEMMSDVKSKETWMMPFEMVPDERWETDSEGQILILRTTVHLKNKITIQDEDEITYE